MLFCKEYAIQFFPQSQFMRKNTMWKYCTYIWCSVCRKLNFSMPKNHFPVVFFFFVCLFFFCLKHKFVFIEIVLVQLIFSLLKRFFFFFQIKNKTKKNSIQYILVWVSSNFRIIFANGLHVCCFGMSFPKINIDMVGITTIVQFGNVSQVIGNFFIVQIF